MATSERCEWCSFVRIRRRAVQAIGTDFTPVCRRCAEAGRPAVMWRVRARLLLTGRTDERALKILRELGA